MSTKAFLLAGAIALLCFGPGTAEDEDSERQARADRLRLMKESFQVYHFSAKDEHQTELKVNPEPLLRWTNPVSGLKDGALFLWKDADGRPAAGAQVFLTADNLWLHEFQSLYERPFQATQNGAPVWSPSRAGVSFSRLPEAPSPANTPVRRLAQMRRLLGRFMASDEFEGKSRWELAPLTTPLSRYGKENSAVLDGALFVFAHGTDPEVFVLIEARKSDDGYAWHYALAPMTGYALKVSLDDKQVWEIGWRRPPFDPDEPFFIKRYEP